LWTVNIGKKLVSDVNPALRIGPVSSFKIYMSISF